VPKVIVKTGTTQDGEFDLDLTQFSWRERAYIAELSGTTPPKFAEKWFGVDPKTVIATVAVMMQRAGRTPDLDVLLDSPENAFTIDYSDLAAEAEDDAGPPDEASPLNGGESVENADESAASG
jgi:hypothetical protein